MQFYHLAARLSGFLSGLCAVLALLAVPATVRADDNSTCLSCCGSLGLFGQDWTDCYNGCMAGSDGLCAGATSLCITVPGEKNKCGGCKNPGAACTFGDAKGTCVESPAQCCTCKKA